jgi:hypothetical protein
VEVEDFRTSVSGQFLAVKKAFELSIRNIDNSGVEIGKKDFKLEEFRSWLRMKQKTQTSLESQAQIQCHMNMYNPFVMSSVIACGRPKDGRRSNGVNCRPRLGWRGCPEHGASASWLGDLLTLGQKRAKKDGPRLWTQMLMFSRPRMNIPVCQLEIKKG